MTTKSQKTHTKTKCTDITYKKLIIAQNGDLNSLWWKILSQKQNSDDTIW